MIDIKELTSEQHKNAERQEFVKTLMSGKISHELYATYLYNQLQCYVALEKYAFLHHLFKETPGLNRAENIHKDFMELWPSESDPVITESTRNYCNHIKSISKDPKKLYAHIYVRHLGDLSGGQMISKRTPGPNNYYSFTAEQLEYKPIVREKIHSSLDDEVLSETKLCFMYATELFREMNDLGKTD